MLICMVCFIFFYLDAPFSFLYLLYFLLSYCGIFIHLTKSQLYDTQNMTVHQYWILSALNISIYVFPVQNIYYQIYPKAIEMS